ncbi:hypothetical protein DUNSADRAFT_10167 [Dunaliella salina]|uniref:Rhodanese domain-containing protein n=1 Tax=Dunaliella salina TaxID=3046 RepID=A0ABQ7GFY7_DUNSA|nr:hypothetical protein DUNSADRAFT_10167 [Dunaliella salina]|eukprot:KAF5833516.1 hypothetical protein DUNSADRAFT_10167 [Dunaliella salina]
MQAAHLHTKGGVPNKTCMRTTGLGPYRLLQRPTVKCQAKKNATGFKWDASNLRWVRDDRYAGVVDGMPEEATKVTPKSGTPYTIWPLIHTELNSIGLKSVTPEQAFQMQKKGWTIVDVRIEGDYDKQHAAGAINIPLYRFTQGTAFWDQVKKIAMAGFAMKATERDPDYVGTALKNLKKGQKIILCCAIGGSLDTKLRLRPDKYKGTPGWGGWNSSNMVFMEGGFQQWRYQGYPCETTVYEDEE